MRFWRNYNKNKFILSKQIYLRWILKKWLNNLKVVKTFFSNFQLPFFVGKFLANNPSYSSKLYYWKLGQIPFYQKSFYLQTLCLHCSSFHPQFFSFPLMSTVGGEWMHCVEMWAWVCLDVVCGREVLSYGMLKWQ